MRCRAVASSLHERTFKGTRPLALLAVGILMCMIHVLTGPPQGVSLPLVVVTLALPFAVLGIGPIPWQWTGDNASKAKFFRGLLQAVVISGVWVGLIGLFLHLLGPQQDPVARRVAFSRSLGPIAFTLLVAMSFGRLLSEKEDTEVQKRSTEELLRESQRRTLHSQLEPHVLYNALNSLAGLIQEDQEMAEEVVVRLGDLYRMLAKQGDKDQIPLRQERELVEAYLVMEQMRLGDRLKTQWLWGEGEEQALVLPLLLQPLVENAIKHGISPASQGGTVVITYDRQGNAHRLQVANTGHAPERGHKGIGLSNLEARLALWPQAKGTLEFTRQDEWTLATVRWTPGELA